MIYPRHVAIIMDGNGRWAEARGLPRTEGHRAGEAAVRKAIEFARKNDISYLTLYSFSEENWQRPAAEVEALMALLVQALYRESEWMRQNGVRLNVIGATHKFSAAVQQSLKQALDITANESKLVLTLALSYGGRQDITSAVKKIVTLAQTQQDFVLDDSVVANHLYTASLPDPDVLIRTGGEHRLSNFLLWQCAYSELFFLDVFWPDFSDSHFKDVLALFTTRQRRYGRLPEVSS